MASGLRAAIGRLRGVFTAGTDGRRRRGRKGGLPSGPIVPADTPLTLPDTRLRDVRIEYDPCLDGDPDPGEVVWTWVAYEDDPTQGKDRPVVIIGRDGEHLAGVSLSSHGGDRYDHAEVGTGSWDRDGRVSYARLDRVLAIDPATVRREGAILDPARFERLVEELKDFHRRD